MLIQFLLSAPYFLPCATTQLSLVNHYTVQNMPLNHLRISFFKHSVSKISCQLLQDDHCFYCLHQIYQLSWINIQFNTILRGILSTIPKWLRGMKKFSNKNNKSSISTISYQIQCFLYMFILLVMFFFTSFLFLLFFIVTLKVLMTI